MSRHRIHIVPLAGEHLPEAARLFTGAYRSQRGLVPSLPSRHEQPEAIEPRLRRLMDFGPGVAALDSGDGGRLLGYLIGFPLDTFKGPVSGVHVPEWAHGATDAGGFERGRVLQLLYQTLSAQWVAEGRYTHAATVLASDREALDTWYHLGFGVLVIDAARPLSPVQVPARADAAQDITVRRVSETDAAAVIPLVWELRDYLAGAPVFLFSDEPHTTADLEASLADPEHVWLVAYRSGEAIAYLKGQPSSTNASFIITDPKTMSVTGAYTRPPYRGTGVASLLLDHLVSLARDQGFARLAVDFESANIDGGRFWLTHFTPVCYSVIRRVDERVDTVPAPSEE